MRNRIQLVGICVVSIYLWAPASHASGPSDEALAVPCNGCHGAGGVSSGDSIPSIAGQDAEFMTRAMLAYKEGKRSATIMNRIAKGYKEYELRKIARYFSRKPWRSIASRQETTLLERGRTLHRKHCAECHEDIGRYQDQDVPRIAGQPPRYLYLQMTLYRDGIEKLPQPSEMADKMALLDETDIKALAQLYSSID